MWPFSGWLLTLVLLLRLTVDGGIHAEFLEKVGIVVGYRLQDRLPWFFEKPPSSLGFKLKVLVMPWCFLFTVVGSRVSNPGSIPGLSWFQVLGDRVSSVVFPFDWFFTFFSSFVFSFTIIPNY